jgi:septal ring factor EnvC (AmiA/AmiB activator)
MLTLVACIAAVVSSIAAVGPWRMAVAQSDDVKLDQHIEQRINSSPTLAEQHRQQDDKLKEISGKLATVAEDLKALEGWRQGVESNVKRISNQQEDLKQRVTGQQAIAKLIDPNRVLATIRSELAIANQSAQKLPQSQLIDYKNAVKDLPNSAHEYWATVAAIINYQSLLNQLSGST